MPEKYQTPQFQETDRSRLARESTMDSPDLKHFLHLANAGYESSGTVAARELADCLVNNITYLDEKALRGMCVFAGIAKMAPETARQMLQD